MELKLAVENSSALLCSFFFSYISYSFFRRPVWLHSWHFYHKPHACN